MARKDQGLSAQEVANRIARFLGKSSFSAQSIYYYESFERHPPIDVFAAWARALGYRLIVELDDASGSRVPVLLAHPESMEVARRMDAVDEKKRKAILEMVRLATPDD